MEIVVHTILTTGIQIINLQIPSRDDVVMTQQHPRNSRQEDLVAAHKRDEDAGRAEQIPGVDGERDDGADKEPLAHGEVLGEQGRDVVSCWKRVLEDRGEDGRVGEAGCDEETAGPVGGGVVCCLKHVQICERVPDQFTKDDLAGAADEISDQCDDQLNLVSFSNFKSRGENIRVKEEIQQNSHWPEGTQQHFR